MRKSWIVRRRKQRRSKDFYVPGHPCWIRSLLAVATLIVLWAGLASVFVAWLPSSFQGATSIHRRTSGAESTIDTISFPRIVDLWPSENGVDTDNALYTPLHKSCLDEEDKEEDNKCQSTRHNDEEGLRVAVLRTPGMIGRALGRLVEQSLFNYTQDSSLDLYPTNNIDDPTQFTNVIRLVTFPILLEAIDLALQSSTSHDQITLSDTIQMTRLVVRWHCHVSLVSDPSSLLTISASKMLAHPSESRKLLVWFLQLTTNEEVKSNVNEWMDPIAHQVIQRIDQCTSVAMQIQQQNSVDLKQVVDTAIRTELEQCTTELDTTTRTSFTITDSSLLVEIAGLLLSVNENDLHRDASSSLCQRFPTIEFCQVHALKSDAVVA